MTPILKTWNVQNQRKFNFNDKNDKFRVDASTKHWAGKNKCGQKNIKIPHKDTILNVNSKQNAVLQTPPISNNDDQQMSDIPRQKENISNLTSND